MQTIILLTKEDIETVQLGTHYEIRCNKHSYTINFTPEALEEFLKDIEEIKQHKLDNEL